VTYEILIRSGTVIDGTGAPALSGTVRRTINAEGLVVAPGFIDPHTHYDARSRR
jgi:N-acyl-D-aspartate/D-glutamate deacylase